MKLSTRQVVISGLLVALTIVMGATGWGFLAVPTPAGAATTMHIPAIIAGVLEGPLVGSFVGLLFGLFTLQFLGDPRVVIPARLFIGVLAFFGYRGTLLLLKKSKLNLRWGNNAVAAFVAGIVGSATNTGGTLFLAVQFGYFTSEAAWGIVALQGVPEALLAGFITAGLVTPLLNYLHKKNGKKLT